MLLAISGDAEGREVSVEGEIEVGRGEEGVGNLGGDSEISRRDARFVATDEGALLVEDL
jgi:hypothetical protein